VAVELNDGDLGEVNIVQAQQANLHGVIGTSGITTRMTLCGLYILAKQDLAFGLSKQKSKILQVI